MILILNGSVLGVSDKKVILQISYANNILNLLIFIDLVNYEVIFRSVIGIIVMVIVIVSFSVEMKR